MLRLLGGLTLSVALLGLGAPASAQVAVSVGNPMTGGVYVRAPGYMGNFGSYAGSPWYSSYYGNPLWGTTSYNYSSAYVAPGTAFVGRAVVPTMYSTVYPTYAGYGYVPAYGVTTFGAGPGFYRPYTYTTRFWRPWRAGLFW